MRSPFKRLLCLCLVLVLVALPVSRVNAADRYDSSTRLYYDILHSGNYGNYPSIIITDCSASGHLVIPDFIDCYPVTTIGSNAFANCHTSKITVPATVTEIYAYAFDNYNLDEIVFLGDPPEFSKSTFGPGGDYDFGEFYSNFFGTVYYPLCNPKWTDDVKQNYGGYRIKWVGYHNWDEGTLIASPTCTTVGSSSYVCSFCGEIEITTTPALGHTWDDSTIISQPTCTQDGMRNYTCTVCSDTKEETINATGHSWDDGTVTSQPTCTQNGVRHYTCTACSSTKEEAIDATGHVWGETTTITAPGCLEDGTLGYICSQCGTIGNHSPITATGHSYESTVEVATCTHPGRIVYTCTACGDVRKTEISPATGHSYVDGLCTVCGQTEALFSGACGADARWEFHADGTLRISGTGAMDDFALSEDGSSPNTPWYPHRLQITKVVIDNGVTSIGEYAFHSCGNLTDIGIPETVTTIGKLAFYNCTGLTALTIPGSVTSIGSAAFRRCGNLTRITLSEGLTTIGKIAFFDCTGLTEVSIPSSVATIGEYAFGNCTGLTAVTFSGSAPSMDSTCFKNVTATANHPCQDATWTDAVKQSYGGTITWTASHSYETITVNPTCTVPGSITTSCTACGDVSVGTIPASGHQYESGTCTACGVSLKGDINGDNTVDISDIACLYAHVNGTTPIVEEAQLLQADTNGDGTINIGDVAKLYAHIKGTTSLA